MGFPLFRRNEERFYFCTNMIEDQERCLKCGKQEGLQGVAVIIGIRAFHLFYLCAKCGDVDIKELLKIIRAYEGKKTT